MKVLGIIQARMGSTRLPGKVMMEVKGKPLIGYLLDSVAKSNLDGVIVASPLCDATSPLADYVQSRGVAFLAAEEENDVAARFLAVLDEFPKYGAFVRMCGDSPLLDFVNINGAANALRQHSPWISNVGRSTPHGQNVEGAMVSFYRGAFDAFTQDDREHAGFPFFYREFVPESTVVDTMEDFKRVEEMICRSSLR